MLDLGTSFLSSVARDADALAIVDGDVRLSYAEWYRRISALVVGFDAIGLKPGDHLVTLLQNRWEAASLHWACQFAGIVIAPVNWRSKPDEIDFYLENSGAKALAFEDASAGALCGSPLAQKLPRIALDAAQPSDIAFDALLAHRAPEARPRADADAWSVMLYTSGTTANPKGVPRRQRAERAAGIAHVAQNLYAHGERTLGVMPLYHTMGVRSLIAMSLVGGAFVCLRRFDVAGALRAIAAERVTNLYLVPTLYHDLVQHPLFAASDVSSVRKLGFAGAPMTDGLLQTLAAAFRPELFVNHYGSSEVYTFTVDQNAPAKPGSAGRAGINQIIRVVKLGAKSADDSAPPGEEGEIVALLAGDESFEGYWRRPEADAKALRQGWYFTGDTGFFDADGDLFVTGRVDDMIITGGENVSPVEIESCLSLHAAVSEVAVVGLPDERWGKIVAAFIKRRAPIEAEELDAFCRGSGLANFKRPRRYVFVAEIPKSPVENCFAANSSPASSLPKPAPPTSKEAPHERIFRSASAGSRRLSRRDRPRPRTCRRGARPAAAQRHRNDAARSVAAGVRGARRGRRRARDRAARGRPAFFQRRQYCGISGGVAGARREARLEHRGAGALRQAGDRRQSRLLLRRRLRDFAGLRFPPGFGDLPVRTAGTAAWPDSRLGRLGAIAKDHRHHPHQRHRHALEAHCGQAGLRLGHRHRMRCRRQLEAATDALVDELRAFSPLAQRTAKTLLNETEDTNLEAAIELEGHCYSRLRQSDDFREGVEAFHAKRKAVFGGT